MCVSKPDISSSPLPRSSVLNDKHMKEPHWFYYHFFTYISRILWHPGWETKGMKLSATKGLGMSKYCEGYLAYHWFWPSVFFSYKRLNVYYRGEGGGKKQNNALTKNANQVSHWFNHSATINTRMQVLFRPLNLPTQQRKPSSWNGVKSWRTPSCTMCLVNN